LVYQLSHPFAGVAAEGLRRQTKSPQKGLAHPARINKTGFLRDNLKGMAAFAQS